MAEPITSKTRWCVILRKGEPYDICSHKTAADRAVARDNALDHFGKPFTVIQVRPVLPGDEPEFRRGLEALRGMIDRWHQLPVKEGEEEFQRSCDAVVKSFMGFIDKLLAEKPEEKDHGDSAAD